MVEMHVEGLSLDPQTRKPIVILRQNDGKGLLPLWVGAMEAMTISLVLNGEELPRPLAHDLLLMVAKALNGTLTGVAAGTVEVTVRAQYYDYILEQSIQVTVVSAE